MPDESGIVLVGMPASGKSTVGRLVAQRLGRPFIDTDEVLERRLHLPAASFIREHGEAAFRVEEAAEVREACNQPGAVIATGGGAVIDPLNRWALWHHGTVVWLDLPVNSLVRRLREDEIERPTLQPYDEERISSALRARLPMYGAADLRLDASASPEAVATAVLDARGQRDVRRLLDYEVARYHPIGPDTARVVYGVGVVGEAPEGVAVIDRRLSRTAPELIGSLKARACLEMTAGERAKRLRRLGAVLEWLAEQRVERDTPLLAVGGGTIGDLAGTAAALFARGLPLAQVPTTWLAQADSAIGGKVAVDLARAKNAVGAFWPPMAVVADVAALRSLPLRGRRDGMAESIKSALIGDIGLWDLLEARGSDALNDDEAARYAIIERSARLKLGICARDPFESGERRALNLGHTVGHALEIESGYRLPHGEAVALGMRAVATIAAGRGGNPGLRNRLDTLLADMGFALRRDFDAARLRDAMLGDKKRRAGRQRWILPMEIGRVTEVHDVSEAELGRALRAIGPS